jgi:hypothetical protein
VVTRPEVGPTTGSAMDAQVVPDGQALDLEGGAGSEGPGDDGEQSGKPSHDGDILVLLDK